MLPVLKLNNQPERTMKTQPTPRMDAAFKQPTSTTPRMHWQLDQCYREGCKLERELAEALSDLEFRRDLFKLQEQQLNDVRAERDRLAEALRECREDSAELLGERDSWQNETRLDYQKRYQETRDNVARADEALQSLTSNELQ
jgi:hypothetical protein